MIQPLEEERENDGLPVSRSHRRFYIAIKTAGASLRYEKKAFDEKKDGKENAEEKRYCTGTLYITVHARQRLAPATSRILYKIIETYRKRRHPTKEFTRHFSG